MAAGGTWHHDKQAAICLNLPKIQKKSISGFQPQSELQSR
jgi:hypothetical protein